LECTCDFTERLGVIHDQGCEKSTSNCWEGNKKGNPQNIAGYISFIYTMEV